MRSQVQKGFTLIELMIVVAIIAILAAIAIPQYQNFTARAQVSEGISLASGLETKIADYYNSTGNWPTDNTTLGGAAGAFMAGILYDLYAQYDVVWTSSIAVAISAGLMAFTRALGAESVDHGIRVVGVNPGPIMSDRHKKGAERVAERELGDKNRWPELYKRFPIGRPGRVEEVANVVAFLASDLASYISGEIIRIDAGLKVRDPVY